MSRDMFFIPVLAKAFAAANRRVSLAQALTDIRHMGSQTGYEGGRAQWHQFLAAARPPASGQVLVGAEGIRIELSVPFPTNVEVMIPDLQPGHCTVMLSTGLVLGEMDLTAEDLIWEAAFDGVDFKMAADTEAQEPICSRTHHLKNGAAQVRTYPGVERGSIGVMLMRRACG